MALFLGSCSKLWKQSASSVISVHLSARTTWFALENFRESLYWGFLLKICREESIFFIRTHITGTYMKISVLVWHHLAEFFLEWEKLQIQFVVIVKTNFMLNIFCWKSCLCGVLGKNGRVRQSIEYRTQFTGGDSICMPRGEVKKI